MVLPAEALAYAGKRLQMLLLFAGKPQDDFIGACGKKAVDPCPDGTFITATTGLRLAHEVTRHAVVGLQERNDG